MKFDEKKEFFFNDLEKINDVLLFIILLQMKIVQQ